MRAVELEPVEAAFGAPLRGADEIARARGPCRRASSRAASGCAGRRQSPTARSAASCPPAAARPRLPSRAASSPSGPRGRAAARSSPACARARSRRCASTRRDARVGTCRRSPGLIRASADDAGHLGEHEPRAAVRAAAEMDEVVVVRRAVDARVLRHRRHDDAVRQRHAAQRERREHRRHRLRRRAAPALRRTTPPCARRTAGSRSRRFSCEMRWLRVSRL